MTVASTSIEAYIEHKDTGKLGKQASNILEKMVPAKDYSRKELARLTGFELSSICGRVNELLEMGMLEELAPRKCSITGKNIHPVKLREQHVTHSKTGSLF
jgi:hypothetical protein